MTSLQNRATTQLITHGRDRTQAILERMNQLEDIAKAAGMSTSDRSHSAGCSNDLCAPKIPRVD